MGRMFEKSLCLVVAVLFGEAAIGLVAGQDEASRAADGRQIEFREDVQYGTGGEQKLLLNLARPEQIEEPLPGLIFIHGGGWSGGNKESFNDFARQAAARGYVAATISYRLAPKHVFPAQIEDCKCAIRWMRAHAEELNVDPERIGAVGASAGAHLAMMLGTMNSDDGLEGDGPWAEQSSKVQAVVSFAGPTDLTVDFPPVADRVLFDFIGGTLDAEGDMYREASPVTYVNRRDAPMLLFHGTADEIVPYKQAFRMATALTRAGVRGRVELLIGAGHGWGGDEMQASEHAMWAFLEQWLKK